MENLHWYRMAIEVIDEDINIRDESAYMLMEYRNDFNLTDEEFMSTLRDFFL